MDLKNSGDLTYIKHDAWLRRQMYTDFFCMCIYLPLIFASLVSSFGPTDSNLPRRQLSSPTHFGISFQATVDAAFSADHGFLMTNKTLRWHASWAFAQDTEKGV